LQPNRAKEVADERASKYLGTLVAAWMLQGMMLLAGTAGQQILCRTAARWQVLA
jgi:hypothetical protein